MFIRSKNGVKVNPPFKGTSGSNNSTTEVILDSVLIPGNMFIQYGIFGVEARVRKNNTNGTMTMRLRINTSNSISGSILVATLNTSNISVNSLDITRRFCIKTLTNNTECFDVNTTSSSDINRTNGVSTLSINWSNPVYIIVTSQLTSSSDNIRLRYLYIDYSDGDGIVA
jgi:hypothetical protein